MKRHKKGFRERNKGLCCSLVESEEESFVE